jgi:hypothetical protein
LEVADLSMVDGEREVTLPYEAACPRCLDGPHHIELVAVLSRGTLLFGGPGRSSATTTATATLICPTTGAPFEVTVKVPVDADERVQSVRVVEGDDTDWSAGSPAASASTASDRATTTPVSPEDWRVGDMAEWRKASATQARDAAAKLLAAGTAAVSAYFAILKYVGGEHVDGWRRVVSVLPSIGYVTVCVLAAVALRPVLMRVYGPDDFERLREERLSQLNRLLGATVVIFVVATALAAFAYVLVWP